MPPTPDGREWLTAGEIARRGRQKVEEREEAPPGRLDSIEEAFRIAYEETGYATEFKVVRLCERLKDALLAGEFGPLGTAAEPTDVGAVYYEGLKPIFTQSVLDQLDENAMPKEG